MRSRLLTRAATVVASVVAMLAVALPLPASADTVYLKILWIRCQDQSEPFSDEIRLYVNGNFAAAWNDVDTRETHWWTIVMPPSHPFSGSTYIDVYEEDGSLDLIGWVRVSESELNQGEHEGLASQIDGQYIVRYVVESNPGR